MKQILTTCVIMSARNSGDNINAPGPSGERENASKHSVFSFYGDDMATKNTWLPNAGPENADVNIGDSDDNVDDPDFV